MKGWFRESYRHYLAAKSIKTARYRVRFVSPRVLRDYEGMNPEAARVFGFHDLKGDEILIASDEPSSERKRIARHEEVESELMKKGMPYWNAHIKALEAERLVKPESEAEKLKDGYNFFEGGMLGLFAVPDNELRIVNGVEKDLFSFPKVIFPDMTAAKSIPVEEEIVKGGLADGIPDSKFDKAELKKGIKVEMEHTDNPKVAKEIAKDHIIEFPNGYYDGLSNMEKCLKVHKPVRYCSAKDMKYMKYGTIKRGRVRFELGSKQHRLLEWKGLPYSVVSVHGRIKRIKRMNVGVEG